MTNDERRKLITNLRLFQKWWDVRRLLAEAKPDLKFSQAADELEHLQDRVAHLIHLEDTPY